MAPILSAYYALAISHTLCWNYDFFSFYCCKPQMIDILWRSLQTSGVALFLQLPLCIKCYYYCNIVVHIRIRYLFFISKYARNTSKIWNSSLYRGTTI